MTIFTTGPFEPYRAEGFFITSMRSMLLAGNVLIYCFNASPSRCDGRSLIHTVTEEPFSVTFPSTSTSTPGAFCNASLAFPVCIVASSPTLYKSFSPSTVYNGRFSTTLTCSSNIAPSFIFVTPMSILPNPVGPPYRVAGTATNSVSYPIPDILSIVSTVSFSIVYTPLSSVTVPRKKVLSDARNIDTLTYITG